MSATKEFSMTNMTRIALGMTIVLSALLVLAAPALAAEFSAEATWSGRGEHQAIQLGATSRRKAP
jgi:hypothetical protein